MQNHSWKTGVWLLEACRNMRSSLFISVVLAVVFSLVYWFIAHAEQREVEALVKSEQRLQHEGAWAVLALRSDDGAVISGTRCGALAATQGTLGTGLIISRNARATFSKSPFAAELTAGQISPSLVQLVAGKTPLANSVAVLGNKGAAQLGIAAGSYIAADIARSRLGSAKVNVVGKVAVANLKRFGLLSDAGLWLLASETGEAESCLVEFEPWVDESVQRAVASLVTAAGNPPDFSRFVRVPQGEDSLSYRYANRASRLLPFGATAIGALVVFGAMTRRRAEIALYRLTGATKTSAKLVVVVELVLISAAAFVVASLLHTITRVSSLNHGQILAFQSFTAMVAAIVLIGLSYPAGSVASAIKDK